MKKLTPLMLLAVLHSCTPVGTEYFTGTFGDTPTGIADFNTQYDDYNSAIPVSGFSAPYCFSTNRSSSGGQFDIVYKMLDITLDHRTGQLAVGENLVTSPQVQIENNNLNDAVSKLNTTSDEFGPLIINEGLRSTGATNTTGQYQSYLFLYSSGEGGNQDIKMLHNLDKESYTTPKSIAYLNTDHNDLYPTFLRDSSAIYFCSDRDGNYDIYAAAIDKTKTLRVNLEAAQSLAAPIKDAVLSSDGEDKCPYIVFNLMVFASNRLGGYGGYDLYYSVFQGGAWGAPVNFGSKINSSSDEFRPIALSMEEFTNDMMVFSSNRPGGKGGFDLYYVGISKIPE